MNKEYIIANEKIYVSNDIGELKEVEYTNNVEQLLIEENVLEKMEKELKEINGSLEYKDDIVLFLGKKNIHLVSILATIALITSVLVSKFEIDFGILTAFSGVAVAGVVFGYISGKVKKAINGMELEKEYLEKDIENQKELIEKLKVSKTKENELENNVINKIDDKYELLALKQKLIMYDNIGQNFDEYYKAYLKGTLYDTLDNTNYSDIGKENVVRILEEKGPKLIKK